MVDSSISVWETRRARSPGRFFFRRRQIHLLRREPDDAPLEPADLNCLHVSPAVFRLKPDHALYDRLHPNETGQRPDAAPCSLELSHCRGRSLNFEPIFSVQTAGRQWPIRSENPARRWLCEGRIVSQDITTAPQFSICHHTTQCLMSWWYRRRQTGNSSAWRLTPASTNRDGWG